MNEAQPRTARAPGVAVLGTLDTKSEELAFLRDCLLAAGLGTVVIDTGVMGEPSFAPDVTASEVARRGGAPLAELRSRGHRAAAIAAMQDGASAIVRDLYEQGRTIIANAAAAMAGMVTRPHAPQERRSRPRVAMT